MLLPTQDFPSGNFDKALLLLDPMEMDMYKLIKSGRHIEKDNIKAMVYDILCAINYIHKAQIVHRDLKPANILVNDDGSV